MTAGSRPGGFPGGRPTRARDFAALRRATLVDGAATLTVLVGGALLAVQGRVNGDLGQHMHSPVAAAFLSFASGALALAVMVAARPSQRHVVGRLLADPGQWYWWLGGLSAASVVAVVAAAVPRMGISLVTVCLVAGSCAGAVFVDKVGLGPGGARAVTARRLLAAASAVGAVALDAAFDGEGSIRPLLIAVILVVGVASAGQVAVNGQLGLHARSATVAGFVSFALAALVLGLVLAGMALGGDVPQLRPDPRWWLYTGGLMGVFNVVATVLVVRRLGVLRLTLANVSGQVLAALTLDAAVPEPGGPLTYVSVLGALLTLLAVAVASRKATGAGPTRDRRPHYRRHGTRPTAGSPRTPGTGGDRCW